MASNRYNVTTIINYCTNDYRFIGHCIHEAKQFSEQIIVPVCDHFLDGTPENRELLDRTYEENRQDATFAEYVYDTEVFAELRYNAVHALSRSLAFNSLGESTDYVLLLDADEIVKGRRFRHFLDNGGVDANNAMLIANYYYFREVRFRARTPEDSLLLLKRSAVTADMLLQEGDRSDAFRATPGPKARGVLGLDKKPMAHHYSWVRTKDEMLKKVRTFGHRSDRDWIALVEEEFSREFNGTDFITGYAYDTMVPYISVEM